MLPIFQSAVKELMLLQTRWAALLNPIIASPLYKGLILRQVALGTVAATIDHRLGRLPNGWLIIDSNANEGVYSASPPTNSTLSLVASGPVIVDLYVF